MSGNLVGLLISHSLSTGDRDEAGRRLVEALRSSDPLSADVRSLIADLLDPAVSHPSKFRLDLKRARGRPASAQWVDIGMAATERVASGMKTEAAVAEVAELFGGLSRSVVYDAMKQYSAGQAGMRDAAGEDEERPGVRDGDITVRL